jgi:hypothetical protein
MMGSVTGFLVAMTLVMAAVFIAQVWEAVFDPQPTTIEDAQPGTILIHFDWYGERRIKWGECDLIDDDSIEKLALEWLAWAHCVRVELKAMDGKMYVFAQQAEGRKHDDVNA